MLVHLIQTIGILGYVKEDLFCFDRHLFVVIVLRIIREINVIDEMNNLGL